MFFGTFGLFFVFTRRKTSVGEWWVGRKGSAFNLDPSTRRACWDRKRVEKVRYRTLPVTVAGGSFCSRRRWALFIRGSAFWRAASYCSGVAFTPRCPDSILRTNSRLNLPIANERLRILFLLVDPLSLHASPAADAGMQ